MGKSFRHDDDNNSGNRKNKFTERRNKKIKKVQDHDKNLRVETEETEEPTET